MREAGVGLVTSEAICHNVPVRLRSARIIRCERLLGCLFFLLLLFPLAGDCAEAAKAADFPPPLSGYGKGEGSSIGSILLSRIQKEPFNLAATVLFFMAITHTFMAPVFMRMAHRHELALRRASERAEGTDQPEELLTGMRFKAELFHFLGEVEAIFGIWVLPLLVLIGVSKGWPVAQDYIGHGVNFTEPMFVVVVMTIAASRPVLILAEQLLKLAASLGGHTSAAWWLSILTVGPVLGSFITEPAAMTISAMLLGRRFYSQNPSRRLAYATLGLLFVNVSVGGTLTHFAAPPVLMVAGKWGWSTSYMLMHFGWKAVLGIVLANMLYFAFFRAEFRRLNALPAPVPDPSTPTMRIPVWITMVHLFFLVWTVLNSHFPVLFIGGFLFYLAFTRATEFYQNELALRPALLVGFFLAGLVVHGGLQGWWIQPVLSGLSELPLFFGAVALTAFNDNAAITYLASLVPDFTTAMKHAVVAGAVVGGGLTVIANAPNPAGQSVLSKYFPDGVSPIYLFFGAFFPTVIMAAMFLLLRIPIVR